MRRMLMIAVVLLGLCHTGVDRSLAREAKPTLSDFAWLAGCWEDNRNGRMREENWTKPAGGTMLGIGRMVKDGRTVEYEFMRLHEENGDVFFTAKPSGQPEATFKLASLNDGVAIFENAQHDFPQRVIYRQQPDGSLVARIEGERDGKKRGIDFPFKRAKCD